MVAEVDGEDFGFVGSVIGVSGDGDSFVGVVVVGGVGFGRLGGGLGEIFGGERQREGGDCAGDR